MPTRAGMIAVIGRPNVGKSTLINNLVGEKVSITANRPQTTRHAIIGIRTQDDVQMVFVDTPGIHQGATKALNRQLNRAAQAALTGVDLVIFMIRALRWTEEDAAVHQRILDSQLPYLLAVNMVDKVPEREQLLPFLSELVATGDAQAVIPISATKSVGTDGLLKEITQRLPEQPYIYDAELYTDRNERFVVAEAIREQATRLLDKELPYALTVEIESFEVQDRRRVIAAVIWVERESQKAIVIGKGGAQLKSIGSLARQSLIHQFGGRVHLELWVRVRKDWSDNQRALKALGYGDD